MRTRIRFVLAAILGLASTAGHADIIFSDTFDTTGGTVLNWDGGANWDVQNGTVDLVASGDRFGIDCLGGTGHCVDLDGSTGAAGEILSGNLGPLAAGDYKFTYWLSGNQRSAGQMDIAVALTFGSSGVFSSAHHSLMGSDGWQQFTQRFTLDAVTDPVYLDFSHLGGDNIGIILDDVQLKMRVSEPATLGLLGLGLLALGGLRRRRN